MIFLYCCTFEHVYRAVAWQWFGQIRYNTVAKRWFCKQRPFLGIGSVNMFPLLGSRFLIKQQLDYINGNGVFLHGPCRDVISQSVVSWCWVLYGRLWRDHVSTWSLRIYIHCFLIGIVGRGVQLDPLGTAATNRRIVPTPGDYNDGEIGGMIGRWNRSTRRKPAPVPLCPPQTRHALPGREPGPLRWEIIHC
jgi:hypothetical protein